MDVSGAGAAWLGSGLVKLKDGALGGEGEGAEAAGAGECCLCCCCCFCRLVVALACLASSLTPLL